MTRQLSLEVEVEIDDIHETMADQLEDDGFGVEARLEQWLSESLDSEVESAIHEAYQQSKAEKQNFQQQQQQRQQRAAATDGGNEPDTGE